MLILKARNGRDSPIRTAVLLSFAAFLVLLGASQSFAQRRTYDVVVERDVMVPMRDGVKLATDVYLPAVGDKPPEGRFPALLIRTAYNKERWGPDIVRFFDRDVTIAGNIKVRLWVSSDAPDTDFYVKLVDVHPPSEDYPRGYGFPVSEGILRARYREGFEKPVLMKRGEKYCLEFPLEPSANRFLAGHRIQIYVAGSNFPNFDINRNTGDPKSHEFRTARNTVHHDTEHPSQIELAIWPTRSESDESQE